MMVEPPSSRSKVGHVAYVSQVFDANHYVTQEMNTDNNHSSTVFTVYRYKTTPDTDANSFSLRMSEVPGTVFIYGGPVINPPQYAGYVGHIVQWDGDTKAQKTPWLVVDDGGQLRRRWIATIATYRCLKNVGAPGPDVLPAAVLKALVVETGVQAACSGNPNPPGGTGSGGGGGPPSTFAETEGQYGVNTFTDPSAAAGLGSRVAPGQQVQVSCKVYAPQTPSVNPDGYWYQIASAPWNGAYYAPANTFLNGDPWNGPYSHNTDFNVTDCAGQPTTTTTTPTTTATTTTAPPPQTWSETTGGLAHTWTDYANAGGGRVRR